MSRPTDTLFSIYNNKNESQISEYIRGNKEIKVPRAFLGRKITNF